MQGVHGCCRVSPFRRRTPWGEGTFTHKPRGLLQPEGRDPGQLLSGLGRTRLAGASMWDEATACPSHRGSPPPGTRAGPCFLGGLSSPCSLLSLNRAAPCSPLAPHTAARGLSIGGDETQLLRVRKPVLISPFRISQVTRNVFMPFKLETLLPAPKPSILKAPCRERAAGWAGPGLGLAGHSCGLPGDRAPGQGAPSQKSYFSRNPSS